jgi:hypothetical protein
VIDANKRQPRDSFSKQYDVEASLREARGRLPLKRVMEQRGVGATDGRWKSFRCPFCQKKGKASVYEKDGQELFRCFSISCPSRAGGEAMDEVGMIAYTGNLSRKEAFVCFLKEAGVWKERATLKSAKSPAAAPEPKPMDGLERGDAAIASNDFPSAESRSPHGQPEKVDDQAGSPVDHFSDSATQDVQVNGAADADGGTSFPATYEASILQGSNPVEKTMDHSDPARPHASPDAPTKTSDPLQGDEGEAAGKSETKTPEVTGLDVIARFYAALTLTPEDEEALWRKRGLTSETIAALGFRSNPRSNKDILDAISAEFDREVLIDSGLWRRRGAQVGPAGQYYGAGRVRKTSDGEKVDASQLKADQQWKDEEGWIWGWTNPVLIPYIDRDGRLISLRPHKGMALSGTVAGTPHPYIPRRLRLPEGNAKPDRYERHERYRTVIVTEGEFKAAALWQILGAGRTDGRQPLGVVALPGISFTRHYETREQLELFLRLSNAERVIVVFDNEDKATPGLAGYKADWQKRHDAEIHARYLATDLHNKLRLHCRVGTIPNSWRDDRGKADWDGIMARLAGADPATPVEAVA